MKSKLLITLALITGVLGSTLLTIGFQIDGMLKEEFKLVGMIGLGISALFSIVSAFAIQQERAELFD